MAEPLRVAFNGRELYADTQTALGQQLWLQTWAALHADIVRPGAGIEAKATIPPEEAPLDDPPNPLGTTGRAELNFWIVLDGPDSQIVQAAMQEAIVELSSNEVIGWVSYDPA